MRKRRKGRSSALELVFYLGPMVLFALALVLWAVMPSEDDETHTQERQGINEALGDYYRRNK